MLFAHIGRALHAAAASFGRLAASDEPSLWSEIWTYLVDRYFSINFYEYQFYHLNLTQSDGIFLRNTIIAIMLGVVVASAGAMYQKRTLGDLVRALQRENCTSADKAMTLEQLGLLRNTAIKGDLRHGTSLKRVVRCVGEEQHNASLKEKRAVLESEAAKGEAPEAKAKLKKWKDVPYRYDFATDRFYIPESLIYGAEVHFDKKGTNPLIFAAVLVVAVIVAALACFFLPELLKMIDNFIGQIV